jgi:hypothetical protein
MGVDEARVGDVAPELEDLCLIAGTSEDVLAGADRDHCPVLDEEGLRDGRLVQRHDPSDEGLRLAIGGTRRCQLGAWRGDRGAGRRSRGCGAAASDRHDDQRRGQPATRCRRT